jgi:hypothetical protein
MVIQISSHHQSDNHAILSQANGSLPAGEYQYYISSVTSQGESLANLISSLSGGSILVTTNTGQVALRFQIGAIDSGIRLYRTGPGINDVMLIAEFNPSEMLPVGTDPDTGTPIYEYVDDGIVGTTSVLPKRDTSGVYTPVLGNTIINAYTTDRLVLATKRPR